METKTLLDKFGRAHDYLRISLTERCNLRCFYCMPEEGISLRPRSEFMSREEVFDIAKTFVSLGVKKIRLTGGEPLLRKDAEYIIRDLTSLPIELAITTNGILINKFVELFKSCGVKSINVSLDSLNDEKINTITRRNYSKIILENIALLVKEGFNVKLNAVLIKGVNDNELIDFVEYTKNHSLQYRFIEFMPFDGNKWDWSKGVSQKEIVERMKIQYGDNLLRMVDKKNDTAKNYKIRGYEGSFAIISSVSNPFCESCNRLRLTADGKLKNCLFSNSETDLLSPYRNGLDIKNLILDSVWDKKARRGGMETFEQLSNPLLHSNNRSMQAIGG